MPCWVVPAVAAELWGVSLEQVISDVAAGRVGMSIRRDVLFVDVTAAIEPPRAEPAPAPLWPDPRSLAWAVAGAQTVVTPAERDALLTLDELAFTGVAAVEVATAAASTGPEPDPVVVDAIPASVHDEGEPAPLPDGPDDSPAATPPVQEAPPQWESIRARVARTRRPPPRARDAA